MADTGGVDSGLGPGCTGCNGSRRHDADDAPLDLDPIRLPRWVDRRAVTIAPGDTLDYRPEDWLDSMLVVTQGAIELESLLGSVHQFDSGSILWCQGLPIRLIRSTGHDDAVLISISRRPRPP